MTEIVFQLPGVVEVGFVVRSIITDRQARTLARLRAISKGIEPYAIVVTKIERS